MKKQPSVAVIGAGLSGLACANQLQAANWSVTVFEKSRGPGGRMSTRRGEDWQCDHGAKYFTASDPAFCTEVARWQSAGAAALWQPRIAVFEEKDQLTPAASLERYVGTPRMTAPARLLAESLQLIVQQTICDICPTTTGWQLSSLENGKMTSCFDAVVVAVPAPQAALLLQNSGSQFSNLPSQVEMRACWALMLRYAHRVNLSFDAALIKREPLCWVAREQSKPGRPAHETWLLHASANWSEAHIEAEPDWVAERLIDSFAELGASQPQAWSAHRWRYAETSVALKLGFCWDSKNQLGLCGDWLHGGGVEGAWLSGVELAQKMLEAGNKLS